MLMTTVQQLTGIRDVQKSTFWKTYCSWKKTSKSDAQKLKNRTNACPFWPSFFNCTNCQNTRLSSGGISKHHMPLFKP